LAVACRQEGRRSHVARPLPSPHPPARARGAQRQRHRPAVAVSSGGAGFPARPADGSRPSGDPLARARGAQRQRRRQAVRRCRRPSPCAANALVGGVVAVRMYSIRQMHGILQAGRERSPAPPNGTATAGRPTAVALRATPSRGREGHNDNGAARPLPCRQEGRASRRRFASGPPGRRQSPFGRPPREGARGTTTTATVTADGPRRE